MDKLNTYLPTDSIPLIKKWIEELDIAVKITKSRNTKLGDFRVNRKGEYLISINYDFKESKFSSNFVKSNVAYSTQACEHQVISM